MCPWTRPGPGRCPIFWHSGPVRALCLLVVTFSHGPLHLLEGCPFWVWHMTEHSLRQPSLLSHGLYAKQIRW